MAESDELEDFDFIVIDTGVRPGVVKEQRSDFRFRTLNRQCAVFGHQLLDAGDGVHHGGVVAVAEAAADFRQGAAGELLGQVHGPGAAGRRRGRGVR